MDTVKVFDEKRLNTLFMDIERRLRAVEDAIKSVQEALKEYGPPERRE
jgi:hypothetical protein